MNKLMLITAVLGACLAMVCADNAGEKQATSGVSDTTSKAMNGVKTAANKGTEKVSNLADGVTVQVERLTNPQAHIPRQSSLPGSAVRGAGRLLRDVASEAGDFVNTVGGAGVRLGAKVPSAVYRTVRESAARVAYPRHIHGDGASGNGNQ